MCVIDSFVVNSPQTLGLPDVDSISNFTHMKQQQSALSALRRASKIHFYSHKSTFNEIFLACFTITGRGPIEIFIFGRVQVNS